AYGGIENSKFPLVLDNSTDVKQLSVSAKDSQLLESREFQITDIARAFGLPSFMVNQEQKSTSWGSGIGEIGLSFLRFTLGPH
ncbi:phage portal protein, partial [Pseudoalteromonas sp. 24-MNA-CIBAN-0067]